MVDTPRSGAAAEEEPEDAADVALGPAPRVAGRERIRADIRARLFGDDPSTRDTDPGADQTLRQPAGRDPDRIGRFRILDRVGAGGMGVVFSAYDPELDRKVAIKLLRPDLVASTSGSSGTSRLQREAQAMARLNHPNVATVHEVGAHEDQVFVAMEYVDGGTLRQWLEGGHGWREVLAKYIDAGAGLAAAHAAGIVHRDFKPDNVMLDREGRVRVMDFGLSRARDPADDARTVPSPMPRDVGPMATPLTQTGALMGTPAYMAPEQHRSRPADERSDQFAFCVALFEGLCGVRPFPGTTYPALVGNVLAGNVRAVPTQVRVPRHVTAAIHKGLSVDPAARHESMQALLAALRADPGRWWRRGAVAVGLMGMASAATWVAVRDAPRPADACASERDRLAGVWDEARSAEVEAALLGTRTAYAGPVWQSTRRLLDEYAQAWVGAAQELCAARWVAADPQSKAFEQRQRCLDARRSELGQLVELLTRSEEGVVLEAAQAAATLSGVAACSDPQQLQAWSVRRDAGSKEALAEARERLGLAQAEGALGRYDVAIADAQEVVDAARELDDPALGAAGLLVRGQFLERAGQIAEAEASLREAVRQAEIASDHGTRALALIRLVYVVGAEQERVAEARALGADASAVLRVIGANELLAAKLELNLGAVAKAADEYDVAFEHYRRALDAHLELFGPEHPETARAYANIGSTLSRLGRADDAEPYLLRALEGFERTLGPEHPHVGVVLNNLGNNYARAVRYDDAIPYLRRALALREKVLGPEHNRVASTQYNLGTALLHTGRYDEARELLQQAANGLADASPDHDRLPVYWLRLGISQLSTGDVTTGRATLDRAVVAFRDAGDHASVHVRLAYYHLALSLTVDDPKRARRLAEAGLEMASDRERVTEDEVLGQGPAEFEALLWLLDSLELAQRTQ
jgi:tetratricopeptide (TPR) repeat protein